MAQLAASHADKGFHQATLKEVAPTAVGATQAAQGTSHLVDSQQTTLIRSVQTLVHQGGGEMVIQLQPRELGEVHIRVSQEQGAIHIQAQAERVEVAQAIRNDLPQILSRLDERGITVAGMDVKIMGSDATSTRTERFQSGTGSGEFTHSQDSFFNQRFDDQQREAFRQRRERFYDTMELVA
jgi:flagellar hook-length control protein FliK